MEIQQNNQPTPLMNQQINVVPVPSPQSTNAIGDGTSETKLYSISTEKLTILWICTFGLYSLLWSYNNWLAIKNKGEKVSPTWRAIFCIFFFYPLFTRILKYAKAKGYQETFSPGMLYIALLLVVIISRINGYLSLVGLFAFLPILPVQRAIRFYNKSIDPNFQEPNKFWPGEIVVTVVGGIWLILALIGLFFHK